MSNKEQLLGKNLEAIVIEFVSVKLPLLIPELSPSG